jgi:hypothetical protein
LNQPQRETVQTTDAALARRHCRARIGTAGRKAHTTAVLPAIPSTWRSPITPCQGAFEKHKIAKTRPLDAV